MKHEQILIKVNAWVDEGIAPLVIELNDYENVITVDSCQGSETERVHVYFVLHSDCAAMSFLGALDEVLQPIRAEYEYELHLLGHGLQDRMLFELSCQPEAIPHLALAIRQDHVRRRRELQKVGRKALNELAAEAQDLGMGY